MKLMDKRQLMLWDSPIVDKVERFVTTGVVAEQQATVRNDLYVPLKKIVVVREGCIATRPVVSSSSDSKRLFRDYWIQQPENDQECFVVACLNTKNRVQSILQITTGTLAASLVHPREVFKPAIVQGSSSVILSHNHPSGDATPSQEDREVTKRLTESGDLLGITVLDHIIYGNGTGEVASIRES